MGLSAARFSHSPSRSSHGTFMLGFDPGQYIGIARVHVGQTIHVHACLTIRSMREFLASFGVVSHLCPPAAIEWWEYQGSAKSRGVPHQAEAAGRVAGFLDAHDHPYVTVKRGEVLSALNLPRNANKNAVRQAVRALTTGVGPSNDHEADAIAIAIAGASRWEAKMRT